VVQPLRRLMAGRTTIVITHDLALAPDADRILVVDRGRLVECGTHRELLARGGAYARLRSA
jgi:ATP-binding cassette subfamily B protein